ncbi:glycosyltransferase [Candidatus Pelagibacter sp.]|uniref:glycosyltransferase n=1 Tax=Candidatus Pelagibacter sp. TaxID=2024849 RepID=UPI003F83FC5F
MKIATILPYKENYTISKAQAAAIWVCDFFKHSKYQNTNFIFGNTNTTDFLTKNYQNISISNLKSKLSSTTKEYCRNIISKIKNESFDIIEIHNRPLIFNYLKKEVNSKYILYFHNDPLSMNGSKSAGERLNLLINLDKIIFVSKWVQDRFFIDLDKKLSDKTEIVYPSIHKKNKISKKDKKITFVGKLNTSKGYDIYKDAITKILDEFKDWKAYSIGDEDRKRPFIDHKNHQELGFLKHKEVLNFLNKSEIAVVPSRWEEPFGRTALESSSRACATIISNRGGLPETTDHCIILKKLNAKELYKEIKKLIVNIKLRKKIQKDGFKNIKHLVKNNSEFIDRIRDSLTQNFSLNYLRNKLRIINIYNTGQKNFHRLYNISLGKKFTNGFIRNGHDVLEISDRDFIRQNRNIFQVKNINRFQDYLVKTSKNYNPDLIFFGHTQNISKETIKEFKNLSDNLIISQWNEDPVMKSLSYSRKNIQNITNYSNIVDHNFITTHPSVLKNQNINIKNLHFLFIPVDKNIECFNVSKNRPIKDLFYAMSHGVNRATLKKGKDDSRIHFLNSLIKKLENIDYDFYGFQNKEPIWGNDFYQALINSKMGLNLSRGLPTKHYSSNRIASLMGNGLLTFVDKKTQLNDMFSKNEIVMYENIKDLTNKINFYKKNDHLRSKIAAAGRKKYFKLFNELRTTKYIIDKSLGKDTDLY